MNTDSKKTENKQCTIPSVSGSAYLAFMRIDYEGIFESSMKLFKSKTEAGKYICELRKKHGSGSVSYDIVDLHCH
jgi:hypothetical protein